MCQPPGAGLRERGAGNVPPAELVNQVLDAKVGPVFTFFLTALCGKFSWQILLLFFCRSSFCFSCLVMFFLVPFWPFFVFLAFCCFFFIWEPLNINIESGV